MIKRREFGAMLQLLRTGLMCDNSHYSSLIYHSFMCK